MQVEDPPHATILIMHATCYKELDKRPDRRCSGPYSTSSQTLMRSLAEGSLHGGEHTHLSNCRPIRRPPLGPEYLPPQCLRPDASSPAL